MKEGNVVKIWALRALRTVGLAETATDVYQTLRTSTPGILRQNLAIARRGADDGLPLPSAIRAASVAGTPSLEWFLKSGARGFECLSSTLNESGRSIDNLRAVLDFGCGCGRVTRHWAGHADRIGIYGADINASAIRWCKKNLPFGSFCVSGHAPPLPFEDAAFDLVYAFSVFTHLNEAQQTAWRDELRRVLSPGGLLILSSHGRSYLGDLSPADQKAFENDELVVVAAGAKGSNYCGSYHPEAYFRAAFSDGFRILSHRPEGALGNPHQDLWVLEKTD